MFPLKTASHQISGPHIGVNLVCGHHLHRLLKQAFLCLASFARQTVFQNNPRWYIYQQVIDFYCSPVSHGMKSSAIAYVFTCWWTCGLSSCKYLHTCPFCEQPSSPPPGKHPEEWLLSCRIGRYVLNCRKLPKQPVSKAVSCLYSYQWWERHPGFLFPKHGVWSCIFLLTRAVHTVFMYVLAIHTSFGKLFGYSFIETFSYWFGRIFR